MTTVWKGQRARAEAQREAAQKYTAMVNNLNALGRTVLAYMRHPEATPENAERVRNEYRAVYQSWVETTQLLREKYPAPGYTILGPEAPWWKSPKQLVP